MSVDMTVADKDLLKKALNKLNYSYEEVGTEFRIFANGATITLKNDKASLPSYLQATLNKIKVAYSEEVIEEAAQTYNWTVSEEEDYVVLRRYSPGDFEGF